VNTDSMRSNFLTCKCHGTFIATNNTGACQESGMQQ